MSLFRLLAFGLGAGAALLALAYLLTGRRHLLTWAWRLLLAMVGAGLVVFAVLLLERLT